MPGESQPPASAENRTWKESYLCFDKAWMATKKPCLTIMAVDGILDDRDFFLQARKVLRDARGGWLQNLISWKSVNKVELSQVCLNKNALRRDSMAPKIDKLLMLITHSSSFCSTIAI
jgi:hypothetical protein